MEETTKILDPTSISDTAKRNNEFSEKYGLGKRDQELRAAWGIPVLEEPLFLWSLFGQQAIQEELENLHISSAIDTLLAELPDRKQCRRYARAVHLQLIAAGFTVAVYHGGLRIDPPEKLSEYPELARAAESVKDLLEELCDG